MTTPVWHATGFRESVLPLPLGFAAFCIRFAISCISFFFVVCVFLAFASFRIAALHSRIHASVVLRIASYSATCASRAAIAVCAASAIALRFNGLSVSMYITTRTPKSM